MGFENEGPDKESRDCVGVCLCVGAWPSKERSDEAKWRRLASPGFEGEIDGGKVRLWR